MIDAPSDATAPIKPGDTVAILSAWHARAYVVDIDQERGRALVRTPSKVELFVRLADLVRC